MIDQPLRTPDAMPPPQLGGSSMEMDAPAPQGGDPVFTQRPDGNYDITQGEEEPEIPDLAGLPHDANLAEAMDDQALYRIGLDVSEWVRQDEDSRSEWSKTLKESLNFLGMKDEQVDKPWEGSCGLFHPMMLEGAVRFQSNVMMEIFPAVGPVRAEIIGESTPDKEDQADRVVDGMNQYLTRKMPDYRPETDKMMFGLAVCGAAFRKIYFNKVLKVPSAVYVPAQNFVMPYGATSLATASRYTELLTLTINDVRKLQNAQFYRQIDLIQEFPLQTDLDQKIDKINLTSPNTEGYNSLSLYECHCELDLPGLEDTDDAGEQTQIALPYIVTVLKQTNEVLSIYRNWTENDPLKKKKPHYVKYDYVPGFGPYGMGLGQLVGQHAKTCTAILRALIDSGTLANMQSGWYTGIRDKNDVSPFGPGEFRFVELMNAGKLSDAIQLLPYKEPSAVLLQLLTMMVEDGRRLASTTDTDIGEVNGQAPVGTTLAVLERRLKIVSAIQARIYHQFAEEFEILARVIRENPPGPGDEQIINPADLDGINVLPVADPNAATNSQAILQLQALWQMAQTNPQSFNMVELIREFARKLGVRNLDQIIPEQTGPPPMDPVSEVQALMNLKPVKAYMEQDHDAYLKVLNNLLKDPQFQGAAGQNPQAAAIIGGVNSAIMDHMGFAYRRKIEKAAGFPLPAPNTPLPGDTGSYLAKVIADATDQVLAQDQAEAAQQQAQQQAQDPMVQIQQAQLALDQRKQALAEQEFQHKAQMDQASQQSKTQLETARIASQHQNQQEQQAAKQQHEQHGTMIDIAKTRMDNQKQQAEIEKTLAESDKIKADTQQIFIEMQKMKAEIVEILAHAKQLGEPKPSGTEGPAQPDKQAD